MKKIVLMLIAVLISTFSYAEKINVSPTYFKQIPIEKMPFEVKVLHLDIQEDYKWLVEYVNFGNDIKEKLPIMGSIYSDGLCILFMQEKGIADYYKMIGINNKTIDTAIYHELGHCVTSYWIENKKFDLFSATYQISSLEEAEALGNTQAYARHVERFGDVFALAYIQKHHPQKLKSSIQFLTKLRKFDDSPVYDTYEGIDFFKVTHEVDDNVMLNASSVMKKVY